MAEKTVDSYQLEGEREYLQQNVLTVQLAENTGDESSDKLGEELNPRNLEHTTDWHIVEVNDKKYDNDLETGWHFVEKGSDLPGYGKAQHSWLVNYETGEIIQLEENNYTDVSAGDMVYVKEDLIINVDSSIIDANTHPTKEVLEKQFGEGVHLYNFSFEENNNESGLTSTSFNFDGIDDCITVDYSNEEQKKKFINRGFTFEFYGTSELGCAYYPEGKIEPTNEKREERGGGFRILEWKCRESCSIAFWVSPT